MIMKIKGGFCNAHFNKKNSIFMKNNEFIVSLVINI